MLEEDRKCSKTQQKIIVVITSTEVFSCICCQHTSGNYSPVHLEFQKQGLKKNSREANLHPTPPEKAFWCLVFHLKKTN